MVDDDVYHDRHCPRMYRGYETLKITWSSEIAVELRDVEAPITVICLSIAGGPTDILYNGADPDRIKPHSLYVVEFTLDSRPRTATILTCGNVAIRRGGAIREGEAVGHDLIHSIGTHLCCIEDGQRDGEEGKQCDDWEHVGGCQSESWLCMLGMKVQGVEGDSS